MIIDLVGGTGGSAFTINKNHIFTDNTARDSYFALNPTEKEDGVLISVGSGFQEYNGANWIEKSLILKGNKGDKGDKGDTGEQGLQGIQGIQGVQGTSGQDASEIVSANFIGNDMVFSKDDTTTFSIINAKVYLTPNIENKQDLLVSGDNIKTISGKTIIGSGDLSITGDDINTSTSTKKMITQPLLDKLSGIESGAEVNDVNSVNGKVGVVTLNQDDITDGSLYVRITPAEKSKLGNLTDNFKGLFANSTARDLAIINPQNGNYVIQEDTDSIWYYSNTWTDTGTTSTGDMSKVIYDPQNINGDSFNRNNHTGTQLANTISDFNVQVSNNIDVINSFKKNIDTLDNIQDGITYVKTTNDFTNTEKSKLAGIEPNATGDQTANEILTLIKTVDGTGSGLDADLLGGQSLANIQSSINSKQDALISGSNIKTINGNSILGSGNIEIIGGGTGAVDSVNGQVGIVVLDADDISDTSTTNKFVTIAEKVQWNSASAGVSTGDIIYRASNTVLTGYLKANGALVSRTTYANLFSAIGTTYGAGDGSTTFNLPDLRGYFIRGWDDGRGIDSGRILGSYQADQNLDHTHTGTTSTAGAHVHGHKTGSNTTAVNNNGYPLAKNTIVGNSDTDSAGEHNHTFTTASSGGTEVRVRNIALMAIIKY